MRGLWSIIAALFFSILALIALNWGRLKGRVAALIGGALGGAQEYFGVTADLACYSKAIANGKPIAVLAGRADVELRRAGQ